MCYCYRCSGGFIVCEILTRSYLLGLLLIILGFWVFFSCEFFRLWYGYTRTSLLSLVADTISA